MSSDKRPDKSQTPESAEEQDNRPGAEDGEENEFPEFAGEGAGADERRTEELEQEVEDLKNRLLRTIAEMENLRKRAEREKTDSSQYAITGFARDMLGIADNLRRALDAVPAERDADGPMKSLLDGVEMTERELLRIFDSYGIRKIVPKGEKFDHNYHQAMFEVEDAEAKPGTVVQVIQPGYVIRDRLLRPAMVGVAKGGKKPENGPSKEEGQSVDKSV